MYCSARWRAWPMPYGAGIWRNRLPLPKCWFLRKLSSFSESTRFDLSNEISCCHCSPKRKVTAGDCCYARDLKVWWLTRRSIGTNLPAPTRRSRSRVGEVDSEALGKAPPSDRDSRSGVSEDGSSQRTGGRP